MTPVLVRVAGQDGMFLLIGFSTQMGYAGDGREPSPIGILVHHGGQLDWAFIEDITIERPNVDYPIGEGPWSRVDAERVPA